MPTALSSTDAAAPAYRRPGRSRPRVAPSRTSGSCSASARRPYAVATLARAMSWLVRPHHAGRRDRPGVPARCAADAGKAFDIFLLMPSAMAGILLLNIASAVASGGGRELISRDQAAPYPVSPTTDHLGALLLAPLNIAWMIQAWILLGSMAYGFGRPHAAPRPRWRSLLWLVFCDRARRRSSPGRWRRYAAARTALALTRGLAGRLGAGRRRRPADRRHHRPRSTRCPTLWVFARARSAAVGLRWLDRARRPAAS